MIKENYNNVINNIKKACELSNRQMDTVTLITVSKTKPMSDIMEAYGAGACDFGENKVQELCDKYSELPTVNWHLIGHLQTNKVKYIIDKVKLIHSVDSVHLANEISRQALKNNIDIDILIQVNIAKEDTKFGLETEQVLPTINEIAKLPNIHIKGLMTIPPFVDNPEDNRQYFRALRNLAVDINNKTKDNVSMDILSMGMTDDYEVAIEEGATMIRVGTGIFGQRIYK